MTVAPGPTTLERIPLHDLHVVMGARMGSFAGYEMPIQYPLGIMKEHLHTRAEAALFDVSHMGQIVLRPRRGSMTDIALALERIAPADILGLSAGRQRYALFTNATAGIIDDFMIAHCGDRFVLVVNASRKLVDEAHLRAAMSHICDVEVLKNRALLALQGPGAEGALARLAPDCAAMRFLDVRLLTVVGGACLVSRSGYTGEDGFEISVAAADAEKLTRMLLQNPSIALAGLGARDTLRTEAGLCLYGSDLNDDTTPIEAALEWTIRKVRRRVGARAGGFPGADLMYRQIDNGPPRRRVGLRPRDRTPVRGGALLYADATSIEQVGAVTSGSFGPSVGGPIAMGYVPPMLSVPGATLFAQVRDKRVPVEVTELPFVPHRYKRG
jgi:aminomethyltransferase